MFKIKNIISLLVIFLMTVVMLSANAHAQKAMSRDDCKAKGEETLKNLDKWIDEYGRQMNAAEPTQKAKYKEWIREMKKLKVLVRKAMEKLGKEEDCKGDACVEDQCSLIDIADQQVTQLIKETEEKIGQTTRYGEESGSQVSYDTEVMGDNSILNNPDPDDAAQPSQGELSGTSDSPTAGANVDPGSGTIDPDRDVVPDSEIIQEIPPASPS